MTVRIGNYKLCCDEKDIRVMHEYKKMYLSLLVFLATVQYLDISILH